MPPPDTDPDDSTLQVGPPATGAAGVGGVVHGLAPVIHNVGIRRGYRVLRNLNQPGGIDCPGCAWPESSSPHLAEFCENGAKAIAEEATRRRCDPAFFAHHSIESLADKSDYWLGQQGRLTDPMYRPPGATHYEPIGWDDAFAVIARHLRATQPERTAFYTSGRTSNEAAFLYQLFVREYGTNNLPDCSNMCHESSGRALHHMIGIGKGTVTLDDFDNAQLILVIGQNPGTNHPRMLSTLEQAKAAGATIVAINPLPEAGLLRFKNPQRPRGLIGRGTGLADHFLQIRVGGDLALFQLVNASLIEGGHVDEGFVLSHTSGYDDLAAALAGADRVALLAATGLTSAEVETFTGLVAAADRIVACWAMGLTQQRHAVATISELVNTLLLRGSIGKPGAGVGPVRGHSNVQGDRTMGIYDQPDEAFLAALDAEFGLSVPRKFGHDAVGAIVAMGRGDIDVFMSMGGNFAAAAPDTDVTVAGLNSCGLTVQVSTKLNRSHVACGREALILPCLGRTDVDRTGGRVQFVTVEDSMGEVHATQGSVERASTNLLSEVAIVCGIAAATNAGSPVPWSSFTSDYALIRERIERVLPDFAPFEERVIGGGRFQLPNPPRDSRTFNTNSGTAQLTVNKFEPIEIPDGRLLLQTVRSHDQFNTTIYGRNDRYRGIKDGRRVVFAHPVDLAQLGFGDGDMVDLVSEWTDHERRAVGFRVVAYPVARRTAAAYFPETNVLVPLGSTADVSRTPTSKSIIVRMEAATSDGGPG